MRATAVNPKADAPLVADPDVVAYRDYHDPLMPLNRAIFAFNDVAYRYALVPLANGYTRVVPEPVRGGVGNFFYNLKMPIYAINHLAQGEFGQSGHNVVRFAINSTLGVLGIFDPAASRFGYERQETHFDETLAQYGAGYGVYLVLPLIGPSDVRSGASLVIDWILNPVTYLLDSPESTVVRGFDYFQEFAPDADTYGKLRRESEDPYLFFRNLHLQRVQRDAKAAAENLASPSHDADDSP
ncbi:hypothetical protein BH24PSE2_BH24PSE2_23340 [soil metagenome]